MGHLQQNNLSVVFKVQVLGFHSRGTKSISLFLKSGWDGMERRRGGVYSLLEMFLQMTFMSARQSL